MPANLIEDVRALAALVRRETGTLSMPPQGRRHERITAAKSQLIAVIEAKTARLAEARPDWKEALPPHERAALTEAADDLRRASVSRAAMRPIELRAELFPTALANPSARQDIIF